MKRTMTLLLLAVVLAAATCMSPVALAVNNGAPAQTQRSGLCGERRSKEAGVVLAARQERSLADFATTRTVHGPFSLFGATEKRKWGVQ